MEHITSRENDKVKYVRRLAMSGRFRVQEGLFFAEGKRLCMDLAESAPPVLVLCTEKLLSEQPQLATLGAECITIGESVAEKIAETRTPQGLFCLFPLPMQENSCLQAEQGLVLCENVQDPSNVGAVLRSAAAFGYGGVVLCGGADAFSPRALRASMGAVLRMPVHSFQTLEEAVQALQGNGLRFYAAAGGGKVLSQEERMAEEPFVLMVGNEGSGLSQKAMELADETVCIPMHRGVESLNAAVAASVLMFAFKQNRQ